MKLVITNTYHFIFNQEKNTYDKIDSTFTSNSLDYIIKTGPIFNLGYPVINQINIYIRCN